MPLISIITTTYKHEKFIAETIDSILNQSFTDWELLIGDDSPDDTTWNVIQEYTIKYPNKIKAWHHSPNKGIVGNMNFLLSHMSRDSHFVAFLEGDDCYTSDNLEKKLEIFEKYPEVQLVYSDLSFIDGQSREILSSFFRYRGVRLYQDVQISTHDFLLAPAGPIASWSTSMVRRAMIERYPIRSLWQDRRYSIADYEFYFDISTHHRVYGIDEPLTQYRRHGGNLSGSNGGTSGDLARWIEIQYQKGRIEKAVYNEKIAWTSLVESIFALEAGDTKKAYCFWKESIIRKPLYKIHYKIAIILFLALPKSLTQKILARVLKRGS